MRELGFSLHEMFKVSLLSRGELPYEEYVPTTKELNQLKEKDIIIYETYWEMPYNFRICAEISGMRRQGVGLKT